jgi:hypothetical protein
MADGGEVDPTRPGELPPEEPGLATNAPSPGTNTDTVPAMLTPGEYVIPKPAVDQVGPDSLDALTQALLARQGQGKTQPLNPSQSSGKVAPFEASVRTMSFGPGDFSGADKPTEATTYGA